MWSQTIIVGNVGRDAEMNYTPQGIAVAKFSVAVNKTWGKGEDRKESTTWFRVTVWRERAETAGQWIKKGMKIMVIGEIAASAYVNKDGEPSASLELTAHDFKFLTRANESGGDNGERQRATSNEPPDESDIPF